MGACSPGKREHAPGRDVAEPVDDTRTKRWAPVLGGDELKLAITGGKVGLSNLGNTCFMNAGLQCLCHLEPFVLYFLTGKYREEVNKSNPLSSKGEVAKGFASLQQALWQKEQRSHNPKAIHKLFQRHACHLFEGYQQQDVQEFLAYCLDALHEDLNRVIQKPPMRGEQEEKEDEKLCSGRDEEFAAALAWYRYLQRGKSFLVDLFQGQLRDVLTCAKCSFKRTKFDAFLYLSVPVTRTMSDVNDAIDKYLEEELLSGEECWHCPHCDKKVNATKQLSIWKLPPILILHLKRFEFSNRTCQFKKIRQKLATSLTIDLSKYVSSPQREHATYDIVAVANHIGEFGSGHYTACCRLKGISESSEPEWNLYDDARVDVIDEASVVSKDAYVLFLVRRGGEGQQVSRQSVSLPEVWPHFVSQRNSVMKEVVGGNRLTQKMRSLKSRMSRTNPSTQSNLLQATVAPATGAEADGSPSAASDRKQEEDAGRQVDGMSSLHSTASAASCDLSAIGFSQEEVAQALSVTNNDPNRAVSYLVG